MSDSNDSPRAEPAGPAPIPHAVIVQIFGQLTLAYGQPFLARWDGVDMGTVHADWRYKLAGLTPEQIAWGLDHLKAGRPPEAMAFREWCEAMPDPAPAVALPPPRGKVQVPPQVREAMELLLKPQKHEEPARIVIARRYVARWAGQPNLSPTQREFLAFYRRVIERYEGTHDDAIAAAKEATQAAVDQYQQEHGHGTQAQPAASQS